MVDNVDEKGRGFFQASYGSKSGSVRTINNYVAIPDVA